MKNLLLVIVLLISQDVGAKEKFKPFQRTEVSKAHAKELKIFLGHNKSKLLEKDQPGVVIRVEGNTVMYRYVYSKDQICDLIVYHDKNGIIYDASASSEICFGGIKD